MREVKTSSAVTTTLLNARVRGCQHGRMHVGGREDEEDGALRAWIREREKVGWFLNMNSQLNAFRVFYIPSVRPRAIWCFGADGARARRTAGNHASAARGRGRDTHSAVGARSAAADAATSPPSTACSREQPRAGPGPRVAERGGRPLLRVRGAQTASETRTRVHMLDAEARDLSAPSPAEACRAGV